MMDTKEWMQNAFNTAYLGLIKQGMPAIGRYGCSYRGDGNTCCAVGMLIPDALYDPRFESTSVSSLLRDRYDFRCAIGLTDEMLESGDIESLLSGMQAAHDRALRGERWVEEFTTRMREIAGDFGLTVPEVPE
jgi:hypothetical protein